MSFWKKEKKQSTSLNIGKKKTNWNQSLLSLKPKKFEKKMKKSLQYLFLLKKFEETIDYKNIKLLKAFLNKYGKIRSRRKTKIPVQKQRAISKAIRKSRAFGLLPFTCEFKA
jgi:small subunit ribosomal protein S18